MYLRGALTSVCSLYRRKFHFTVGMSLFDPCTVAGSAFGTARSAMGISALALKKPDFVMRSMIPVVMSGVLSLYGIILSVIVTANGKDRETVGARVNCTRLCVCVCAALNNQCRL